MTMKVVKNDAGEWSWDSGRHLMQSSCHHHQRHSRFSACGGCYARAVETLSALAEDKEIPEAKEFIQALKEEGRGGRVTAVGLEEK